MHTGAGTRPSHRNLTAVTTPQADRLTAGHATGWLLALRACRQLVWALLLGLPLAQAAEDFLPPEKAFRFSARALDQATVEVVFDIERGYYLYREPFRFEASGATLGQPDIPAGKVKFDENFAKNVETYRGQLRIRLPLQTTGSPIDLQVVSQGCADAGLCYPPMTSTARLTLTSLGTSLSGAAPATASAGKGGAIAEPASGWGRISPDKVLRSGNLIGIVAGFFVMGLLLSFTPCVLPMLPILSALIVGSGEQPTRLRGLALAASYSLGMAVVYTGLGIAAGLAGEGLAGVLQQPWILLMFALLISCFSLAMFDVYELRLPASFMAGVTQQCNRLRAGRLAGVFAMGGLSALIVSPCVTAPLAGALLFISQSRDVALGGSALFAMTAGMSVPLLLMGASAQRWVPRSGSWMHAVKHVFGVILLAVAIYVAQPALAAQVALAAWGLLLLVTGFMLKPFDAHPHHNAPRVWLQRALGVFALTLGVLQLVGAVADAADPLRPLAPLSAAHANASRAGPTAFRLVRNGAELDEILRTAGRPVMLDFYADWCVSCKEMERFTFSDPEVAVALAGALLLKADVTQNSVHDRELLKRFQLFGPPGTLFFNAQGQEIESARVVGFQNATRFRQTLRSAGL